MKFEDAKATLIANVVEPHEYDRLTTWQALYEAADAEMVQATYHLSQLEDVARIASDNCREAPQSGNAPLRQLRDEPEKTRGIKNPALAKRYK